MPASLENKTVRPGSLRTYSYYHSNRLPSQAGAQPASGRRQVWDWPKILAAVVVVAVLCGAVSLFSGGSDEQSSSQKPASHALAPAAAVAGTTAAPAKPINPCANNTLDRFVLVSVSRRHMWACEQAKTVHDSVAITGILTHESTLTPPGTYQVYAKITDTTLTGSDETGSWNRQVDYWLPFLDNQYGTYGFHDATWRADTEFGKVDPASDDASHGCVELPLASMKWLYEWAGVGTTVTVES